MVKTTQDKIEAEIVRRIEDAGLEVTRTAVYSNIVDYRATEPGKFKELFCVHVSYQGDRMNGGILLEGDRLINGGPYRSTGDGRSEAIRERCFLAHYSRFEEMEGAFNKLTSAILDQVSCESEMSRTADADFEAGLVEVLDAGGEASLATDVLAAAVRDAAESRPDIRPLLMSCLAAHLKHAQDNLPEPYRGMPTP